MTTERSHTLLVTGAQGFLGRHVVREWLRCHPAGRVVGVGRSAYSDTHFTYVHSIAGRSVPASLPASLTAPIPDGGYEYSRVDVRDIVAFRALVNATRPAVIVHSAAALRGEALDRLIESNVVATASVAHVAAGIGSSLVIISSGSVHGLGDRETSESGGPDPYAATKRASEQVAGLEFALADGSAVAARVFNLVGAGLQDRHLPSRVALDLAALEQRSSGHLHLGDLSAQRDLIDVRDAARAVVAVASARPETLKMLPYADGIRIVDVGTGVVHTMRDVVQRQLACAELDSRVHVDESVARPLGALSLRADPAGLVLLGAQPSIALDDSLREMAAYSRSHL